MAKTPTPPYYAVIFTSIQSDRTAGYEAMAEKMVELAALQQGFLGIESARDGIGITISYWQDLASIEQWREHSEHLVAQQLGREVWYLDYRVRIAKIERDYSLDKTIN